MMMYSNKMEYSHFSSGQNNLNNLIDKYTINKYYLEFIDYHLLKLRN